MEEAEKMLVFALTDLVHLNSMLLLSYLLFLQGIKGC